MRIVYGLGRAILGGFYLYNGVNHLTQTEALKGYAEAKQVPNAELSVKVTGAVLALSGVSLLLGWKPRLGALATLGFLGAASPVFHDFWNVDDPQQKQSDLIQFAKNVALMGAALAVVGAEGDR